MSKRCHACRAPVAIACRITRRLHCDPDGHRIAAVAPIGLPLRCADEISRRILSTTNRKHRYRRCCGNSHKLPNCRTAAHQSKVVVVPEARNHVLLGERDVGLVIRCLAQSHRVDERARKSEARAAVTLCGVRSAPISRDRPAARRGACLVHCAIDASIALLNARHGPWIVRHRNRLQLLLCRHANWNRCLLLCCQPPAHHSRTIGIKRMVYSVLPGQPTRALSDGRVPVAEAPLTLCTCQRGKLLIQRRRPCAHHTSRMLCSHWRRLVRILTAHLLPRCQERTPDLGWHSFRIQRPTADLLERAHFEAASQAWLMSPITVQKRPAEHAREHTCCECAPHRAT